jgi:predicted CopG family antitoxin
MKTRTLTIKTEAYEKLQDCTNKENKTQEEIILEAISSMT